MSSETRVLLDGLRFPEGPRWHDGRLWFSDNVWLPCEAAWKKL